MSDETFEEFFDKSMAPREKKSWSLVGLIGKGIQVVFVLVIGIPILLAFFSGFRDGFSGGASVGETELEEGLAAMQEGRVATALEIFKQVANMPGVSSQVQAVAKFRIVEWNHRQAEHAAVIETAAVALAMPDLPEYYRLRALVHRGEACLHLQDLDASMADLEEVLATQSVDDITRALALRCRAMIVSSRGDLQQAMEDETEALRLTESNKELQSQIRYNRAVTFRELGDTQQEMAEYTAVITSGAASNDFLARSLLNRSVLYFEAGQMTEALRDLEDAEQLGDVAVRFNVLENLVVFSSHQENLEEELSATEKLLGLTNISETQRATAYHLRGLALLKAERAEEAREALIKARALAVLNQLTDVIEAIDAVTDDQLQAAIE